MRRAVIPVLVVVWLAGHAGRAQESPGFKLDEHTVNAGGHPDGGAVPASTSYRITLDAVGDAVAGVGPSSPSFRMDAGFSAGYPPPGEVTGLTLGPGKDELAWSPERSVGSYNLYRDLLGSLAGLDYGTCRQQGIADETTTDSDVPPPADGFFYLVTADNRLEEEGTKGFQGDGITERTGNACP